MRITFVLDGGDNLSGGHRAIAMFASHLMRGGHYVYLVARPPGPPPMREKARALLLGPRSGSEQEAKSSHFSGNGVVLNILKSRRPVRDRDVPDADVVVATWWETAEWIMKLAPSKGIKVHLMQDYETWGGAIDRINRSCGLPIAKIVTANWLQDLLQQRFHQVPIAVVPVGVDRQVFDAPFRSKQTVPTVGLTYSTTARKGCDISIQAYRLARQVIPNLRLIACGSTPVSELLPLPEGAFYEPYASDHKLRELYNSCDAWLFGSRVEGFGLPILEAMACRTPVVGTPAGAAEALLGDGAGVLVRPEDPEDMAGAIVRVCKLTDLEWEAMSNAAYAKAAQYSWDEAALAFERALMKAVSVAPSDLPR